MMLGEAILNFGGFGKGIPPKIPLYNSGLGVVLIYPDGPILFWGGNQS